ncbi:ABC-type Co2+ transport system, periplasmic component [Dissulfuribacter thermophilus]|uniref:ABC-type Co2+ transport system, periplasmic component n=1 Tax=Dissulfuribacter thermophilus TaxID=1156395 RepID=A0A1B9F610_9BACT|nr:DUF4198 domain-containing protein [Dissulfuribacter thermophilus]OCC15340.1 ABC-type Co2+ transport system, periplasmic component [Dissulfuribacter thermophilus]
MKRQKIFLGFILVCFLLSLTKTAKAHFMWINPKTYQLNSGQTLNLTLGWGHSFPGAGGDFLPNNQVEQLYFIDPLNNQGDIGPSQYPITFKTTDLLRTEGTYLLVAERKGGFFTKTVEGFKRQSKEGLTDVLYCKYSRMFAKSIVNVGKPGGKAYQRLIGSELEVIPLANPSLVKAGEYLPIKVLLRGKPFAKQFVYATYVGFSSSDHLAFSYVTKTDSKGNALIRLDKKGIWLIMARFEEPYKQKDKCDYSSLISTLTFEIP